MSATLDIAHARADLADAALAVAETLLHTMALAIYPPLQRWPVALALQSRHLEAAVEHPANRPLAQAYSQWRRAQRQATKARSALHLVRLEEAQPRPTPKPQRPKIKRSIGAGITYEVAA
jgi:hypothetical protein